MRAPHQRAQYRLGNDSVLQSRGRRAPGKQRICGSPSARRSWHIKEAPHLRDGRLSRPGSRLANGGDYPSAPGMFWCWRGLHSGAWEFASLSAEAPCTLQPAAAVDSQQLVSGAILVENVGSWHYLTVLGLPARMSVGGG